MKGSILFLLAFVAGESEAQPFVYCAHGNDNLTEIIRLNLRTGLQKHVKWERSPVGELTSDPAGRWLFYPLGTNFYAVNLADTVDSGSVPFCTDRARVVAILPHTGRYIIDGSGSDGDIFHQRFVIYDKTLSEVGSIVDKDVIKTDVAFPTANEGMLLFSGYDSVGGGNYIGAYEFDNRLVEWKRMLADIGPIGVPKKFVDGEKGRILVAYHGKKKRSTVYQVYDPSDGSLSVPVTVPWKADVALSANARLLIAQKVDAHQGPLRNTGHVRVYDAMSGKLLRKVAFPPGGDACTFTSGSRRVNYHVKATDAWFSATVTQGRAIKGDAIVVRRAGRTE